MDEGSGTIARDSSGKGNTGTLQQGATWAAGKLAGALQLDGVNDHVTIPALEFVEYRRPAAHAVGLDSLCVHRHLADGGGKVNADNSHTAPYFTYMLGVSSTNKAKMFVAVGGATVRAEVFSQQTLITGNWYHLTGVYNGAQLKIYVNGVLDGSKAETRALTQRTSSVRIGVGGTVNEPLKGIVDDVRIYNRALSVTEVSALHRYTPQAAALPDGEKPSIPTGLTAVPTSTTAISLSWTGSTDNVGVAGYRVYRNGTKILTNSDTTSTSAVNQGLTAATTYSYTVTAYDAAGNESLASTAASATTLSGTQSGSATQPDLTTGLQGYWALDEGSGTIARDSSGKGNTGTLQQGATWAAGKLAGALQLDGVNDHVTIPHSSALNIGGRQLTLSAWIRFASTGTWQTAVDQGQCGQQSHGALLHLPARREPEQQGQRCLWPWAGRRRALTSSRNKR